MIRDPAVAAALADLQATHRRMADLIESLPRRASPSVLTLPRGTDGDAGGPCVLRSEFVCSFEVVATD